MDPDAVAADLRAWWPRFATGNIKAGIFGPKPAPQERLAVKLGDVATAPTTQALLDEAAVVGLQPDGLSGPKDGTAFATSERLVIQQRHGNIREWRWANIYSARMLDGGAGVALRPALDEERLDLVGPRSEVRLVRGHEVLPPSDPMSRLKTWLRVEATFVASREGDDAVAAWLADLPARLARDQPPRGL